MLSSKLKHRSSKFETQCSKCKDQTLKFEAQTSQESKWSPKRDAQGSNLKYQFNTYARRSKTASVKALTKNFSCEAAEDRNKSKMYRQREREWERVKESKKERKMCKSQKHVSPSWWGKTGLMRGPMGAHMGPFGSIWGPHGPLWTKYGPLWARMGPCGPVWALMWRMNVVYGIHCFYYEIYAL